MWRGGPWILYALVPGFFSYALWRVLAAIYDGDRDGSQPAGLLNRTFGVVKGCAYAALGVDTARLATGNSVGDNGWMRDLFGSPAGHILMFVLGAGLFAFGCFEAYRAYGAKLSQGLRISELAASARQWIIAISRFGIGARAAVIGTFGVLILRAASRGSAETPDAGESIRAVAQSNEAVYFVIGAGLIAYGLYLIVLARYRRVEAA